MSRDFHFLFAFFLLRFFLDYLRYLRTERFDASERRNRRFRFRFHIGDRTEVAALDVRRFHLVGAERFFECAHDLVRRAMAVRREDVCGSVAELGIRVQRQMRTFRNHEEDQTAWVHAMFKIVELVEVALFQRGLQTATQEIGVVEQIEFAIVKIADHMFRIHSHIAKGSFVLAGGLLPESFEQK